MEEHAAGHLASMYCGLLVHSPRSAHCLHDLFWSEAAPPEDPFALLLGSSGAVASPMQIPHDFLHLRAMNWVFLEHSPSVAHFAHDAESSWQGRAAAAAVDPTVAAVAASDEEGAAAAVLAASAASSAVKRRVLSMLDASATGSMDATVRTGAPLPE